MFDIGWTELLVVGVVALIVVGPKDLPGMFRTLGRFTGKMKGMAREFQRAMDDAADQSGVKDVAKDLRSATSSKNLGLDALNNAADRFEKWKPGMAPKTAATVQKTDLSPTQLEHAKVIGSDTLEKAPDAPPPAATAEAAAKPLTTPESASADSPKGDA